MCQRIPSPLWNIYEVPFILHFWMGPADYYELLSAKRGELTTAGITHPSPAAIWKAITREELAQHCWRRTRGATETTTLIEALLLRMTLVTDANGAQLFSEHPGGAEALWEEQKKHLMRHQGRGDTACAVLCQRNHLIAVVSSPLSKVSPLYT